MSIVAAIVEFIKVVAAALGLLEREQERQAGRNEVESRDAKTEADAARKAEQIAVEGTSDEKTVSDLDRGAF